MLKRHGHVVPLLSWNGRQQYFGKCYSQMGLPRPGSFMECGFGKKPKWWYVQGKVVQAFLTVPQIQTYWPLGLIFRPQLEKNWDNKVHAMLAMYRTKHVLSVYWPPYMLPICDSPCAVGVRWPMCCQYVAACVSVCGGPCAVGMWRPVCCQCVTARVLSVCNGPCAVGL